VHGRRAWLGLLLFALPSVVLAAVSIRAIEAKLRHPGAALDDSYIHFQYARAIAEGHPFRFEAGEPVTSGATSLLWPALLAPFYAVGLRGNLILWPAWVMSFAALGLLAFEAFRLTERLAGRGVAAGAALSVFAFSAFTWCAASGMEVVPFAWVLARTVRRASEWAEADEAGRTRTRGRELVLLAWAAAFLRPEGALAALFAAATLAAFPAKATTKERARAALPALAVLVPPLLLFALTGSPRSMTATVKLMPGNPYYGGAALVTAALENAKLLVGTLLNGDIWSAEFLPHGAAPIATAGLVSIGWCGWRGKARWRAAGVLLLALAMFAPCFYVTFLWNRLRYLWPFATGWLVGVACFARLLGDGLAGLHARLAIIGPVASILGAVVLAQRLDWVIEDVSQSASGIDRQQVRLGRWADANLPRDARIGVNDTGAIAYFGNRRTFDVVGLTTAGEARYWVAGAGSRLEHYERLHAKDPSKLPTHFIVYPEWMQCEPVLGMPLYQATVTDATILGGQTMRAYEADYELLGSGERPWSDMSAALDVLDVADLESEGEHEYELLGARDGEEVARASASPEGLAVVDGGRTRRSRERFVAHLRTGARVRGIVRLESSTPTRVEVLAGGVPVATLRVAAEGWEEDDFVVPPEVSRDRTPIELRTTDALVAIYHYWFLTQD
jgi:hypothetical protein